MSRFRIKYPDEVVAKAQMLRSRGLTYTDIVERLAEKHSPAPSYETVRDWLAFRSTRVARLDARQTA